MYVKDLEKYPWPRNLIIDLHDALYEITLDDKELLGSVEYVLNVVKAPEGDIHLLREHYQEKKSINRIAIDRHADRSIIRKKISGVLYTIKETSWLMDILEMGVKAYSQRSFIAEGNEAFRKAVEEAKNREAPPEIFAFDETTDIISLDLSSRAYNGLK